jgi:dipeptidyl aminopeptidase/acylaminoacyl peptidase
MLALLLAATLALTPEEYATMPLVAGPRLSPDGKRVAYVVTRADLTRSVYDSDVWMIDADGANQRQLTRSEANDNEPRWSPDGKLLAFLSDRTGGRSSIFLADPNGGEPRQLTNENAPVRDYEWSPDGKSIAFLRTDPPTPDDERRTRERDDARVVGEGKRHAHLHVIDVESGAVRRLTSGPWSIFSFSWSPDGKSIAFDRGTGLLLDDYYRTDIYAVSVADAAIRPVVVRTGIDRQPRWSPDGKSIAFLSGGGIHDWLIEHVLHVVDAAGGAPRIVGAAYGRIPDEVTWSADSRALWFEGPLNTTNQLFRINVDGSGYTNVSNFEGMVRDVDIAGTRAVFVQESLTSPPELHVSDTTRFAPRALTSHTAAYRNRAAGETKLIRWRNPKDNLEIEGLVTFPAGYKPGTRVPLLVFVHGGPASRFDQSFLGYLGMIYAPQSLAASGFAILRPNPRGSGGYGEAFRKANRNDWGGMDWVDINAGVDKLIADGIADPERMGLMGWSYGGYMAAWAIGHSDRFKAISVGAAIVDLLSYHGTADIREFIAHYFDRRETPPPPDITLDEMRHGPLSLELLRAHSPLWNLKRTSAKVLIQHGENDDRVPLSQGTMLYRILDEMGVDVTMVVYPRSGHTPREPKLRIDVARRNHAFFSRWVLGR